MGLDELSKSATIQLQLPELRPAASYSTGRLGNKHTTFSRYEECKSTTSSMVPANPCTLKRSKQKSRSTLTPKMRRCISWKQSHQPCPHACPSPCPDGAPAAWSGCRCARGPGSTPREAGDKQSSRTWHFRLSRLRAGVQLVFWWFRRDDGFRHGKGLHFDFACG